MSSNGSLLAFFTHPPSHRRKLGPPHGSSSLAAHCALTAASKDAPFEVDILTGYDTATDLPDHFVDLVHRTVGSAGRLVTEDFIGAEYFANWVEKYGTPGQYLETVAVCVMMVQADTFRLALGVEPRELPAPVEGEPENPDGALHELAGPHASWVPTVSPPGARRTAGCGPSR